LNATHFEKGRKIRRYKNEEGGEDVERERERRGDEMRMRMEEKKEAALRRSITIGGTPLPAKHFKINHLCPCPGHSNVVFASTDAICC
jgi:hypothetical protein